MRLAGQQTCGAERFCLGRLRGVFANDARTDKDSMPALMYPHITSCSAEVGAVMPLPTNPIDLFKL
jgi:hypothetical protein